jgi:hypothetical protein
MSSPATGADEFGTGPLFTDPLTSPARPGPAEAAAAAVPLLFQQPVPQIPRSQNPANERKTR